MTHTFSFSVDYFMDLLEEYKRQDIYNYIWLKSNLLIVYNYREELSKEEVYRVIKEMVLLREKRDFFQLSFFLGRLLHIAPDFYVDYTEGEKQVLAQLREEERSKRNWPNLLRLFSRFQLFDPSLVNITEEERKYMQEQLLEYRAEKLYWDFVMMDSFAIMVDSHLGSSLTTADWKQVDKLLEEYKTKDKWAYIRLASWIVIIEKGGFPQ